MQLRQEIKSHGLYIYKVLAVLLILSGTQIAYGESVNPLDGNGEAPSEISSLELSAHSLGIIPSVLTFKIDTTSKSSNDSSLFGFKIIKEPSAYLTELLKTTNIYVSYFYCASISINAP